jgi:hypothetical protein
MKKVFVSGSRGISELPAEAKASLDKIRELFTIFVGTCYGVSLEAGGIISIRWCRTI